MLLMLKMTVESFLNLLAIYFVPV